MKRCSVKPYEGQEPYIFISYCHKDRAAIFPIIENLARDGYRVWYDEGIDPGSEWPEIIASHLNGCTVCIAFLSVNSLNSHNCRREINFALLKNKQFISVIIEPVKMSPGMEMQISSNQAIFKYKYSTESEFYTTLYSADFLKSCKGLPDYSVIVSRPEDYRESTEEDSFTEASKSRQPFSDKWFTEPSDSLVSTTVHTSDPSTLLNQPVQENNRSKEQSISLRHSEVEESVVMNPKDQEEPEKHISTESSDNSKEGSNDESCSEKESVLEQSPKETNIASAHNSQDQIETQRISPSQINAIAAISTNIKKEKKTVFYLIRVKTNESIRILPGKIIFGRSETRTDYQILGNSTIGRVHASVELRDGVCYIVDLNSKNKTKINKITLEPEKEYELKNNDKVQMSNEVFIFKEVQE